MFSVPVMSLNRYCANLKISRLHLFLQLILALCEGLGGGWGEALKRSALKQDSDFRGHQKVKNQNQKSSDAFHFAKVPQQGKTPLLPVSTALAVSAWPSCLSVVAVMIMSEWRAARGTRLARVWLSVCMSPGSSAAQLHGKSRLNNTGMLCALLSGH